MARRTCAYPTTPIPQNGGVDEEYVEAVLAIAERVPRARATTYSAIAEAVRQRLGRGGPRQVGSVMASHGDLVCWWRVVNASGRLPDRLMDEAHQRHLAEGTPLMSSGAVHLREAFWEPEG